MHSDNRMMQGFFLRSKGYDSAEGLSKLKWQNISACYNSANAFVCGTRKNGAAYWSPTFAGFSASVGYFEDDEWGAALRFKNSFSLWGGGSGASKDDPWLVGAGIGYSKNTDERYQTGGGGEANGPNPPSPRRTISGTLSATSRIGRDLPPSSISRPACLLSAPSASRRRTTPTPFVPDFTPGPAHPR